MSSQPTIDAAERRRRLAVRHHLTPPCRTSDLVQLADDLVAIHATDPASVYLGILTRTNGVGPDTIAHALYDERSLLRVLGMRRTMFVVTRVMARVINSGATQAIARNERRRLLTWLRQLELSEDIGNDVEGWLTEVEAQTVAALEEMGEATATELSKRVPGLRVQISVGKGSKWAGKIGVSTRMVFLLASEGRIIRGRPRGSWLSSTYAWAPMDRWVDGGLPLIPVEQAQGELARRWLGRFGPGTLRDLQWWTGWTMGDTRRALSNVAAVNVGLGEGQNGFALADDVELTPESEPWVALLPALDTTTMGWTDRSWYLGDHGSRLFDRNGNAGPTVWVDGRIAGGWAQRASGEVVYRLLEDVSVEARNAVDAEVSRISEWLGATRFVPRFRTPLEMELA